MWMREVTKRTQERRHSDAHRVCIKGPTIGMWRDGLLSSFAGTAKRRFQRGRTLITVPNVSRESHSALPRPGLELSGIVLTTRVVRSVQSDLKTQNSKRAGKRPSQLAAVRGADSVVNPEFVQRIDWLPIPDHR